VRLAFALFKYFPFGGLQQDMLRIAMAATERGHSVKVFCGEWQGDIPVSIKVVNVTMVGSSNASKDASFVTGLTAALKQHEIDLLVGFNRMPGLDVYYGADSCFAAKVYEMRSWFTRFLPRYKHHLNYEKAIFSAASNTHALLISKPEKEVFKQYYQTPEQRLHLLPPGIRRDRVANQKSGALGKAKRAELNVIDSEKLLLMVGSGFRTKGLDRAIIALANLPKAEKAKVKFFVAGQDKSKRFMRLMKKMDVESRVVFLGGRDDIPELLLAADLLIHPAYRENTGTALLEAMVAGLPVVATDVCGYSSYIRDFDMGIVLASPFNQSQLNQAVAHLLFDEQTSWQARGVKFATTADIFDLPVRAVEQLEAIARRAYA
jgi:UDP-glucose:(heptosyl)LPS alpha-1,3-glucosyltransferase